MPHHILIPNEGSSNEPVGNLFNAYQYKLLSLERVVVPQLSMATYTALAIADEADNTHDMAEMAGMLYRLQLLSTSLNSLYECLRQAYWQLDTFVEEGSDFQHYAAHKRMEDARWNGYTDAGDVTPDGQSLVLRTEPELLAPFQLRTVLADYFPSATAQGERIGSSGPETYAYFSSLVANELVFTLRDPTQPATPSNLTTYRRSEAQELGITEAVPPDERFEFVDSSMRGPVLVEQFNAVLVRCQEAATLFASLGETDVAGYQQLFAQLTFLFDGKF